MTHANHVGTEAVEPDFPESYPTFWEAIPVDAARKPSVPPGDAYTTFTNLAEDGGRVTLTVEQSDVGQL
jgi:hypothetical protein